MARTLHVELGVYDKSKSWLQINDLMKARGGEPREVRISEDLWSHLLNSSDPDFFNVVQTVSNAELLKGILGYIWGAKVTSEKMLRAHTSMEELPSMHYMYYYVLDPLAPSNGSDKDLLDLINV